MAYPHCWDHHSPKLGVFVLTGHRSEIQWFMDKPWFIMDRPWFIMVYHGLSWINHGLSWFIMVYHGLSSFCGKYLDTSSFIFIFFFRG